MTFVVPFKARILGSVYARLEEYVNAALLVRLSLASTLIRHENAALILRLGLPSSLIRHENGAFQNCSSNRRNLKTLVFRFCVEENALTTKLFENDVVTIITSIT